MAARWATAAGAASAPVRKHRAVKAFILTEVCRVMDWREDWVRVLVMVLLLWREAAVVMLCV